MPDLEKQAENHALFLPTGNGVHKKRSALRKTLPQILATLAFGMLIFSVSTICVMPTIVIGALHKKDEFGNILESEIPFTDQQASWFGSVVYIAQPLGSLTSGFIQDHLGRKRCMMAVTIPQFIGWIILYFAQSIEQLFTAAVIMGLSVGFMEAPAMSYLGEVCEPRLRGTLSSFSEVFLLLGILFKFFIGAMLTWRNSCAVALTVPVLAFILLSIVPESPTWYLLNNRNTEAEKSLRWLRGWLKSEEIQHEFIALTSSINQGYVQVNTTEKNEHNVVAIKPKRNSEWAQMKLLNQGRVYRPIILTMVYFFIGHCISLIGLRTFLVSIFKGFNTSLSPYSVLVLAGLLQTIGSVFCAILIHKLGKRVLMIASTIGGVLSCFLLAIYIILKIDVPWVPVLLFCVNFFCGGLGSMTLPWVLVCEIFPLDAKGFSAGLVAASSYVFMSIISKTYVDMASVINLEGALIVYGIIGIFGFVFLYFRQPETEGKTLAEIEEFFQDKS
ncbi:facilitated trehalose transporter Tret1-like [Cimex lectularius]|uniref:Major facilitator superfamily (MFS) profile domain-containing protein n=1 Tax=Cimex lectularius TaxID=79782 RepID=A0A8I6S903_CIMLE|nr:facilitated trehalose transporter Tret1-like [Cimex lectularius]